MSNLGWDSVVRWGAGCVLVGALAGGCSSGTDETRLGAASDASVPGTLSIPLRTVGASGSEYQLDATLDLAGPERVTLDLSGADDVVVAELQSGFYEAFLFDGWTLSRLDAAGPRRVRAVLTSDNPSGVEIVPNATSELVLRFRVDDGDVVPGEGVLVVGIEVDEVGAGSGGSGGGPGSGGGGGMAGGGTAGSGMAGGGGGPDDQCSSDAGRCVDDLLGEALASLADVTVCLPATTVPTPIGFDAELCGDSVCADGSPGCPISGIDVRAAVELLPAGLIELAASGRLRTPIDLPVSVPALGASCRFDVTAAFPAIVASFDTLGLGDGPAARLLLATLSLGEPVVDVLATAGGASCFLLQSLDPATIGEPIAALVTPAVAQRLAELAESADCRQCDDGGCPLRCRVAGGGAPAPPPTAPPSSGPNLNGLCARLCRSQAAFHERAACDQNDSAECFAQCTSLPSLFPPSCSDEQARWLECLLEANAWECAGDPSQPARVEGTCLTEELAVFAGPC